MDIVLHAHHAHVPADLVTHVNDVLQELGKRARRAVNAVVRFIDDGTTRRVEIVLTAPRTRDFFAHAVADDYAPAFARAVQRLESQLTRARSSATRARRIMRRDDAP